MQFSRVYSDDMSAGLRRLARQVSIETVLDVGASNGCWAKMCSRAFPHARYVLFEPQPCHQEKLARYASAKDAIVVAKAVGAVEGTTFFDASDPFGGVLMEQGEGNIEVPMTSIDASITQLNLNGPFLLKLDTHGVERQILEGARSTLEHCAALIIEAYNHRITDDALLFWELCEYLNERGFRPIDMVDIMRRSLDQSLWQMDLFFVKSSWPGFSSVAFE